MKLNRVPPITPEQHAKRLCLTSERFRYNCMSENAESEINYTKRKDRTYLKRAEWNKDGYCHTDATKQLFDCPDQIDRIHVDQLTTEDFIDKYERPAKPVILKGVTQAWKT
jgi:hypothetical protein